MSNVKFKVGDKVRRIREAETFLKATHSNVGDIFTVLEANSNGLEIRVEPQWRWWNSENFEICNDIVSPSATSVNIKTVKAYKVVVINCECSFERLINEWAKEGYVIRIETYNAENGKYKCLMERDVIL